MAANWSDPEPATPIPAEMTTECFQCGHPARYHHEHVVDRPCWHCNAYGGLCEGEMP